MSFVPIANTFFNWSVWGFGKVFPVGLPETHPILPRSEVAEPQYYFFPHTPWIMQQQVTQWLSTWLSHGCV